MIGSQTYGCSFGGLGSYLETGRDRVDPSQRVGWLEFRNLPTRRMDIASCIMAGTASLSYTKKPVFHLSISFAPGDPVDEALMKRVMVRTLSDIGLGEHQAVMAAHIDTDDPHVHTMVNRVHPETGVAWKGSWSRLRVEASLRQQELDEDLRVVPGWLARVPGHPELRPQPRLARGDEVFLREVQDRAGPVLERARSWAAVEAGLAEFGLSVRVNGRGMSVTDGRREVKASGVGRQFSRGHLERRLGRYSDYSARVAAASAPPVRDPVGASPAPAGIESKPRPEPSAISEGQPRFSLHEDGEIFGVWDCIGPQVFFAETRERAEAEMQRANWLAARYPNIRVMRCLRDMDGEGRDAHGLPRLSEEKGRPLRRRIVPARTEPATAVPAPVREDASFLDEVRSQAKPALRLSESWAELEHDLAELGLFLRVKGGGFIVTDGQREVKASEVGREFSRFYLEKRLGRYLEHPEPVAAADVPPALLTPSVQPEAPAQHVELPEHQAPAAAPQELEEVADAPRFTLYEDEGIFGVYDSAGPQVFFAETRERALEEVERANEIVELYPKTISMRHLREMDGAWRDAHGLPRLPEPEGRRIVVPAPEGMREGLPPLPPPAGEAPAPAAAPQDGAPTPTPERTSAPSRAPEPVVQSPPAPAPSPARTVEPPPLRQPAPRPEPPVPVRKGARPLTDRERYRTVLHAFKAELAALYRDPRVARRAFVRGLEEMSPDAAARALESNPERYGRLRWGADLRCITEAGRWAELYARWQVEGTRLYAREAAARFRRAVVVEEAETVLGDAKSAFHRVAGEPRFVADRARKANEAERNVEKWLREIYYYPTRARERIEAYRGAHGRDAMVQALRESPEHFGELRARKYRLLVLRDTSDARWKAGSYATWLDGAFHALADRPTREERARADEAVRAAQRKVDVARSARDALGPASASDSVRDGLLSLHAAERGSADRVGRIDRQVTSMLPTSAVQLVRNLMQQFAQEQKRERSQEPHRSTGPDIN